jgi:type IV secretion system protein VirD4
MNTQEFLFNFDAFASRVKAAFAHEQSLHNSRFARPDELKPIASQCLDKQSLLLAETHYDHLLQVQSTPAHPELGNMLIVGRSRSGKGLHAGGQGFTWPDSFISNDLKGEARNLIGGYRETLGDEYCFDPEGYGHAFDPLEGKFSEDDLFDAATHLLFQADEGQNKVFTDRAITMLQQMFLAARQEEISPFPYLRFLINNGPGYTATRLKAIHPQFATKFLGMDYAAAKKENFQGRFFISCWGTLDSRLSPILTETVIRSLTRSDFTPEQIMCSEKPVSLFLCWPERKLLSLAPLVRLVWGTLLDGMCAVYDQKKKQGQEKECRPVLCSLDEFARTKIPLMSDYATTVVGRRIYLQVYIQSLSQLDVIYGRARAQVLRDNMDSQIYYRPADVQTAEYLENRLGYRSAWAHSKTRHDGREVSEGEQERFIPLLSKQEIMQLPDEAILGFTGNRPPFQGQRIDWRRIPIFAARQEIAPPPLPVLPKLAETQFATDPPQPQPTAFTYISPNGL